MSTIKTAAMQSRKIRLFIAAFLFTLTLLFFLMLLPINCIIILIFKNVYKPMASRTARLANWCS